MNTEYRCEWVANSERCHYAGTVSHSLMGSGPWYCHEHFRCNDGMTGAAIVSHSAREYPHPEWTVAAVRAREYPPTVADLPAILPQRVRAISRNLRETVERGFTVSRDPERAAERAAIQSESAA